MQFGLAGAVAAHGVQMHPRLDHVRREDGCVALVGGHCSDDIGAAHSFGRGSAARDLKAWKPQHSQIAHQLSRGLRIGVVEP